MEEATIYRYSKDTVKRDRQRTLLLLILFPALLAVFFLVNPAGGDGATRLCAFVVVVLFIEVTLIAATSITLKKMQELTLTLTGEALERTGGKSTERIAYRDIRRLEILQDTSSQTIRIKIETAAGQVIYLHGLEQMESIGQRLEDQISDQSLIYRKRQTLNWNNPVFVIAIGLGAIIFVLWIQGLGQYTLNAFNAFASLALAVYLLTFKPMTRSRGKRFEKFERIAGIVLLILSITVIALWLLLLIETGA